MDPAGIVWKLDHILDVRDTRLKDEVKLMAPAADEMQTNNLGEHSWKRLWRLTSFTKSYDTIYIQGKKTLSLYIIMQIADDTAAGYERS